MAALCFCVQCVKGGMKTWPMNIWIVLLRGVNVGGNNKLPMAELRAALTAAGFEQVKTYIQSGNVVLSAKDKLSADGVSGAVKAVLDDKFDIQANVMVLSGDEMKEAAKRNPFGQEFDSPNWMFLSFLSEVPESPDRDTLNALATENERWDLIDRVFYFYAGDGAARSKILTKAGKLLGVSVTGRNWNTVQKLLHMTGDENA